MKVIIVGAGDIGYVAAETTAASNEVLIIENDADKADMVKNRLNVSVLHEDGTNPNTIRYAIETHGADIIISTLSRDDSNLFVCMMAKRIKPTLTTVASITNPDYIIETTSEGHTGVDVIISPELITANKMFMLCTLENALDFERVSQMGVSMCVYRVPQDSPLIGSVVLDTFDFDRASVIGLYRNDEMLLDAECMEIHSGDIICVAGTEDAVTEYNRTLGVDDTIRDIIVLGGTIVGVHLSRLLSQDSKKRYVRIIERDRERCRELSKALTGVVIVNGDFSEPEIQSSENLFRTDCLVAVTNQDDTNLLMCMSGQKYKTNKIITRYLKKEYMDIFTFTGLDSVIGFDRIVSNEIAKCVMSDSMITTRVRNHDDAFFLYDVKEDSKLAGMYYGDIQMPKGAKILTVRRDGETLFPLMDTRFVQGDRLLVFTDDCDEKAMAKVFGRGAMPGS